MRHNSLHHGHGLNNDECVIVIIGQLEMVIENLNFKTSKIIIKIRTGIFH